MEDFPLVDICFYLECERLQHAQWQAIRLPDGRHGHVVGHPIPRHQGHPCGAQGHCSGAGGLGQLAPAAKGTAAINTAAADTAGRFPLLGAVLLAGDLCDPLPLVVGGVVAEVCGATSGRQRRHGARNAHAS